MLVNCVAYQEGRKLADIPKEDISEYLKQPGCFVWVALKDPSPAELDEMREEFSLHELAVDDARSGHQRPKIEEYGDSLFAVLHMMIPWVACPATVAVLPPRFSAAARIRRRRRATRHPKRGSNGIPAA